MLTKTMPLAPLAALLAMSRPAAALSDVRNDAMDPGKLEQLLKDVKAEVSRVGDDVKRTAESALKQSADAGKVTAEVAQKADQLLTAQGALKDAQNKLETRLSELSDRNLDLEQRLSSRFGGAGGREAPKSLGEQVGASDAVKQFAAGGARGTVKVEVQNAITSASTSAGTLIVPEREAEVLGIPRRQMTIRQLLDQGSTTSNLVQYAKQTARTNAAAPVAEGALKPESNYEWRLSEAAVRTIAHWIPVSRQAMDDIPQLQGEIDGELRYGLDFAEEAQILKGSGVGENLNGLMTQATAYAAAFTPAAKTMIDTMRLALLQASLTEFPADGIVLHPTDWARIELTKDAGGNYIFANIVQLAGPQLWGRPVISTQAQDEDNFLVGAFRAAAKIYDRMDVEVLISSEDRDNFVKNMLTVRAEKRLALAVKRPAALIKGRFSV
ncbi:phage major capsid protein [Aureimonas sp. D3]|uniref:phage major capsid protein n=1 Tax=Aureimonas sp. D3 TaxID=1638164 RepID=UPI00078256E3|nr:phage major capsid protein [Aureimonas sp. D3]